MVFDYAGVNEKTLIDNIKNGERASFDVLVSLYRQSGINIAYNMVGNLEDAKDVLQDSFVKAYFNIKSFHGGSKFSTWFYRIIVNCSLDFLRRRKTRKKLFSQMPEDEAGNDIQPKDTHFSPAEAVLNKELSLRLDACIETLPEQQKACFILKHRNGLSVSEIAEILKCKHSTVKVHLFRAARNLQHKLAPYLVK